VIFQMAATDIAMLRALASLGISETARETTRILDVGCAGGRSLAPLIRYGFHPRHLHGIDILEDRVALGVRNYPAFRFLVGDGTSLPYRTGAFDVVMESAMFVQVLDEEMARQIASEMRRVTKPGGAILLGDWRYDDPRRPGIYRGVSRRRIMRLFPRMQARACFGGALVPPVGRRLSRSAPSLYFLAQRIMPILVGYRVMVLGKER
jgi:SAM-dependent methyltransferase